MDYKKLGNTDTDIAVLGLGSWELDNGNAGLEALKYGLDNGIDFVDTAEIYGTEGTVGKAIAGRDVFLATKVWSDNFDHRAVIMACENSLQKLGISSIDLYQLHWPNHKVPISETMTAMDALWLEGKVKNIGVSNFGVAELKEAQNALKNSHVVSNQVEYSVIMREPEKELFDYCEKENITIIAYSPLGHGALFNEQNKELLDILAGIGKRHHKSAVQVALNWLISHEQVVTIPKATSKEHVKEDIGAIGFELSPSEIETINKESEKFQQPAHSVQFRKRNASKYGYK